MTGAVLRLASRLRSKLEQVRVQRHWDFMRSRGLHIGRDVFLPPSTSIDPAHCYLIHIGDHCGFG